MPSLNSRTISARLNNELADSFSVIAQKNGYSPAGYIVELARRAVLEENNEEANSADADCTEELPEASTRLYGVAFNLIDDLIDEGYPESEIERTLTGIRRELL